MRMILRFLLLMCLTGLSAVLKAEVASERTSGCNFPETLRQSRPAADDGATQILVAAYLIDIPKIDDATQSFDADIFFRFSWQDERLAHSGTGPCTVALSDIWNPRILIANQRQVERQLEEVVEISPEGAVRYVQRFYGTFSAPLDLRPFPFDKQWLPITLVARAQNGDVVLTVDPSLFSRAQQLSIPNWHIGELLTSTGDYALRPGQVVPQFEVSVPVKRHSGYYLWKLLIPMSIVALMSWATFWISPQHIAPRIGLCATSMLTLIAFRLALASSLPPIPYLTRFDMFMVGVTVLVFLALVQAVATTALWDRERPVLAGRLNRGSRLLFPVLFLGIVALSFLRPG